MSYGNISIVWSIISIYEGWWVCKKCKQTQQTKQTNKYIKNTQTQQTQSSKYKKFREINFTKLGSMKWLNDFFLLKKRACEFWNLQIFCTCACTLRARVIVVVFEW